MALTLTTADKALKEFYLPNLRMQLNDELSPTLTQLERSSQNVEGRRAVLAVHYGRNVGVASAAEGGALPTAGNQQTIEERVSLKYHYGRIQINGPVLRAMKSDKGSFVRALEFELSRVVTDLKQVIGRQVFNDSTQSLARCGVTSSSTTVVLHADTTATQLRAIQVGMVVDIGNTTSKNDIADGVSITAVDRTLGASTITISGSAVTTDANDYVSIGGSAGYELTGLAEIVASSGTLFNIDPSTYEIWKSYVDDNSGTNRTLTDNIVMTALDSIQIESGEPVDLAVSSHGVIRAYSAQLTSQKRYVNTQELKGGNTGIQVSSGSQTIALMADRFCTENTMYLLNTKCLTFHESADWEFMQEDGAVLARVDGYDAYSAVLFTYRELMTDRRNAHGRINDITEA